MSVEKISEIFDIPAILKQKTEVEKSISAIIEQLEGMTSEIQKMYDKIGDCKGLSALKKAIEDSGKATSDLAAKTNEYNRLMTEKDRLNAKLTIGMKTQLVEIEKMKLQYSEQTREIRNQAKAEREQEQATKASSASIEDVIKKLKLHRNSISELNTENKRLRDLAKSMDYVTQAAEIAEINKAIDANTAVIELNSDAYVKQKMNIGNYKSAVKGLDKIMTSIQTEMKRVADAGGEQSEEFNLLRAEFEKAKQKSEEYAASIRNIEKSSVGLKQELRELKDQMAAMEMAGTANSEAYNQLRNRAVELTGAINAVNDQIKNMEPPTAVFDSIMGGLQGIAGGFELWQGAMGLLNIESGEFEKIQAKVQSAMAIINGLTAWANVLDKDKAFMTGLNTAAQSKNIIVSKTAIVVQKILNAALSANPIFLLVTAILAGAAALGVWLTSTKEATEEQKRNNEVHNKAIDGYVKEKTELESLSSKIKAGTSSREDQSKMIDILTQKYGENYVSGKSVQELEKIFVDNTAAFVEAAMKRAEAQAAFELAVESQKQALEAGTKQVEEYVGWWGRLFRTEEREAELANERRQEEIKGLEEQSKKYLEIQATKQQEAEQVAKKSGELTETEIKENEKSLQSAQKLDQLRVKSSTDAQNDIISNAKSSYKEKIIALNVLTKEQIEAVKKQRDAELGGVTNKDERALIARKTEDEILKIRKQGARAREKLDEQEAQTIQQIADIRSNVIMEASRRIMDGEKTSYAERLNAQFEFEKAQKDSLLRRAQFEMQGLDANSNQVKLIQEKLQADLLQIEAQGKDEREKLQDDETVKRISKLNSFSTGHLQSLEASCNKELLALSRKYAQGNMSEEAYEKEKFDIAKKYNQLIFDEEMRALTAVAECMTGEDRVNALNAIKQKQLEFTKSCNEQEIASNEKVAKSGEEAAQTLKEARVQLASEAFNAIASIASSMFDSRIQEVDEEIEKINEQKEAQLAAVDEMEISDTEKEERKKIIEEKAAMEQEKLDKKKKKLQLQQAKVEKAQALVDVAISTAVGVAAAWSNPWAAPALIPIIITTGILQAAMIAAQPLPKYAKGTENHPGGLAVVGDGGKKELVETPSGEYFVTPNTPTLVDLPKHSKVLPDFALALKAMSFTKIIRDEIPNNTERLEKHFEFLEEAVKETTAAVVNNRPQMNIHLDKNGVWTTYETRKGKTMYTNNRLYVHK